MNVPDNLLQNVGARKLYQQIKQRSRPPGIPVDSTGDDDTDDDGDEEEAFETPPTSKKRKILKRLRLTPAKKIRWTKFEKM